MEKALRATRASHRETRESAPFQPCFGCTESLLRVLSKQCFQATRAMSAKQAVLGKSKGGLTKGGLSPKFSEKIGGKSFLRRNRAFSGQIGTFSGPIGAFSGPIGTNSSAPHRHGGRAEIAPKGAFLAQLAPFGPSPPLLSPPLNFPDCNRSPVDVLWAALRSRGVSKLSFPKTLRFENAETLRFLSRGPKNR